MSPRPRGHGIPGKMRTGRGCWSLLTMAPSCGGGLTCRGGKTCCGLAILSTVVSPLVCASPASLGTALAIPSCPPTKHSPGVH